MPKPPVATFLRLLRYPAATLSAQNDFVFPYTLRCLRLPVRHISVQSSMLIAIFNLLIPSE